MKRLSWKDNLIITAFLTLFSFLVMSHWMWRPSSPDECTYLGWGMKLFKDGSYESVDGRPITKVPPLHVYAIAFFFRLFGPTVDVAQCVSLVFGCITVGLAYIFGVSFWGWKAGLISAIFLLFSSKGEFWRYSNRVLNDVPLTFFVFCGLYFICRYGRTPSIFNACGFGLSVGLGLLTKEFAVLLLPLALFILVLSRARPSSKIFHAVVAIVIIGCLLWPWVVHVTEISGSPLGGVLQRGQGRAKELIASAQAWGLRPLSEWIRMITFFGKPSWLWQLTTILALLWGSLKAINERDMVTGSMLGLILVWIFTFGIFVALPLDFRRFVPVLPVVSVLTAVMFCKIQEVLNEKLTRRGLNMRVVNTIYIALVCVYLANSISIISLPKKINLGRPFTSKHQLFLKKEVDLALLCTPSDSVIISNYSSLLYFYSGGNIKARRLPVSTKNNEELRFEHSTDDDSEGGPILYDFVHRGKKFRMTGHYLENQVKSSGASFVVFFRVRDDKLSPREIENFFMNRPQTYRLICSGENVRVFAVNFS